MNLKVWLEAFRLRTLPLALSSTILGSFLARFAGAFSWTITLLAIVTTIALQILSNLANDFGDFKSGADNDSRTGPQRTMQAGIITESAMKKAIIAFVLIALASGISLILASFQNSNLLKMLLFLLLGLGAIAAAIKYTAGKNPYGYKGLGDLFVFLFFGLVGVLGTFYLHTNKLYWEILLPAISIGLFSTAVLNLNNLRDHENDAKFGKKTLVVIMGFKNAKIYHLIIVGLAWTSALLFLTRHYTSSSQLLFLLAFPVFLMNLVKVFKTNDPQKLDPELKKIAFGTLLFAVLFGLGWIL